MAKDDRVYMKHPETEAIGGPVPRKAFEKHWSEKGWVEADPPELTTASGAALPPESSGFGPVVDDNDDIIVNEGGNA